MTYRYCQVKLFAPILKSNWRNPTEGDISNYLYTNSKFVIYKYTNNLTIMHQWIENYTLLGGGINMEAQIKSCLDKFSKIIRPEAFLKSRKDISKKGFKV
jgi:hypothetical protein